MFKIQHNIL